MRKKHRIRVVLLALFLSVLFFPAVSTKAQMPETHISENFGEQTLQAETTAKARRTGNALAQTEPDIRREYSYAASSLSSDHQFRLLTESFMAAGLFIFLVGRVRRKLMNA